MVADAESLNATTAVTSGENPIDPILQNPSGIGIRWAADDTLLFMSYRDGFPHLYSLQHPGSGNSKPLLLTPGSFMVEQMTTTPDHRFVIYNANTGPDRNDVDRRHLYKVPVNAASPAPLTKGIGIEWGPVVTGDGQTVAYLASGAQRPPAPGVIPISGPSGSILDSPRILAPERLPADFPTTQLVTPELVSFRASDGVEAHGQWRRRAKARCRLHSRRWTAANDAGMAQPLGVRE
jgi:hypothetical protein